MAGTHKEKFARDLGSRHYIDNTNADVSAALRKLGGAVILGIPAKPLQVQHPD
jgi:hypothetical protein